MGMDIDRDQLRRDAADTQAAHVRVMRPMRELLARLFDGGNTVADANKAGMVLGDLGRRRFLRIGGLTIASAAVLAACGDDDEERAVAATTTTALSASKQQDLTILRTATSLELLAVDIYDKAVKSGLVTTAAIADAARLFQSQHQEHAVLFQAVTEKLGGEAFTTPNPVVAQSLQPRVDGLRAEPDVVTLALDLEKAAAATYQASVGTFSDSNLNQAVMSVGGVEARHVAVLAGVLQQATPAGAFQTTAGAVAPDTGV
jgi:rubrerythrin